MTFSPCTITNLDFSVSQMITNIPSYYAENKDYIYTKPIFHPCFVPNEADRKSVV